MNEVWPEVMVTAHRKLPNSCDGWLAPAVRTCLARLRDDFGMRRATTGMAVGGDHVWGFAARDLGIPLRAAIPYPSQPLDGADKDHFGPRWTKRQRADWEELKQYAQATGGVEYVSHADPRSFDSRVTMLHQRNDWMLQHDDAVVGIWAPSGNPRSGTRSCLRKAFSAGKPIILINLVTGGVTRPLPHHWSRYLDMPVPRPKQGAR